MNHGTTNENHNKGACPLCGGLGNDWGDGADAGVGSGESGAVVADDKDDLSFDAKVADFAKEHVGLFVKARDGRDGRFGCARELVCQHVKGGPLRRVLYGNEDVVVLPCVPATATVV